MVQVTRAILDRRDQEVRDLQEIRVTLGLLDLPDRQDRVPQVLQVTLARLAKALQVTLVLQDTVVLTELQATLAQREKAVLDLQETRVTLDTLDRQDLRD